MQVKMYNVVNILQIYVIQQGSAYGKYAAW